MRFMQNVILCSDTSQFQACFIGFVISCFALNCPTKDFLLQFSLRICFLCTCGIFYLPDHQSCLKNRCPFKKRMCQFYFTNHWLLSNYLFKPNLQRIVLIIIIIKV